MVHRWQSQERAQLLKGRKLRDRQGELEDALIDLKVQSCAFDLPSHVADLLIATSAVELSPCPPRSNPKLRCHGMHAFCTQSALPWSFTAGITPFR